MKIAFKILQLLPSVTMWIFFLIVMILLDLFRQIINGDYYNFEFLLFAIALLFVCDSTFICLSDQEWGLTQICWPKFLLIVTPNKSTKIHIIYCHIICNKSNYKTLKNHNNITQTNEPKSWLIGSTQHNKHPKIILTLN